MNDKMKVILVNGDKSNWYEQAIFIVRADDISKKIPVNIVYEAEKIVNNYIQNKLRTPNSYCSNVKKPYYYNSSPSSVSRKRSRHNNINKNKKLDHILNICILFCCSILFCLFYYIIR